MAKHRVVGFSLIELIVAMAVAILLIAVGLPAFMRAYRVYQLNNAARQTADILRLTRYEAIRLNKPVSCKIQATGSTPPTTNVWADSNSDGNLDPTEKMILLGSGGNLVGPTGTPPPIASEIGAMPIATPSPSSSTVQFDARGAVSPPTTVNVFYLSNVAAPETGFRAVVLMPAGGIQIWTSDQSGNWQQLR